MTTPPPPAAIAALRRQWEDQMEAGHDSLPPWYWSRPEREARRDAWVARRLAALAHPLPTTATATSTATATATATLGSIDP